VTSVRPDSGAAFLAVEIDKNRAVIAKKACRAAFIL
jgi:hypothetical protein